MATGLTDFSVKNMRAGPARREIADRTPLLYLVLQPSGRRRFVLRYRFDGAVPAVPAASTGSEAPGTRGWQSISPADLFPSLVELTPTGEGKRRSISVVWEEDEPPARVKKARGDG